MFAYPEGSRDEKDGSSMDPDRGILVCSEVGRLRRVLVHSPGDEFKRVPPARRNEFLLEDIPFVTVAREEGTIFQSLLRGAGAEVLSFEALLADVLADHEVRRRCLRALPAIPLEAHRNIQTHGGRLLELSSEQLTAFLVAGAVDGIPFTIDPIPNITFQRDIGAVIGRRILPTRMREAVRQREAFLFRLITEHHPVFRDAVVIRSDIGTLEGGDVCVVRNNLVVVGCGHRTDGVAIQALSEALGPSVAVLVVELPNAREHMHLDTVFTLIDQNEALVYRPVVEGSERLGLRPAATAVFRGGSLDHFCDGSLISCLREFGVPLNVISCGGGDGDHPDADQEQWWDGANALAVAPGRIVIYDRNERTITALRDAGYAVARIASAEEVPESLPEGKTVFVVPGAELSRARGGPHCMTMPLLRDAL